MRNDVTVIAEDLTPLALEQCAALYCKQDASSSRAFSTHLYCADEWHPTIPHECPAPVAQQPEATVTRFQVPESIITAVDGEIFGGNNSIVARTDALSAQRTREIAELLQSILGVSLQIRPRIKPIASLPSHSMVTGNTTDGLHLDGRQEKAVFRVGLNLGSANRYVICALSSLDELAGVLGGTPAVSTTHAAIYDYSRLLNHELCVIRFRVPPGWGWMMRTEHVLHDGRRADADLPSRFVLLEAEVLNR